MAQIKISELNAVSSVGNNDVLPIVNGGDTKKVTITQLKTAIGTPDLSNYLAKNNTTSFVPSGDYNPSTKKYVDDSVSGMVTTTGSQTISGAKTFSTLPQSSATPSNNTDLVTKTYVDTAISTAITTALGGSY